MMASNSGDVKTNKSTSEMADQGTTDQKATSESIVDQKATSETIIDHKATSESTTDQKTTPESTSETTPKSRHCAFCLKEFVGTTTW
jgi:hypothetical protein